MTGITSGQVKYSRLSINKEKAYNAAPKGFIPIRFIIVGMVVLSCTVDYITRVNINVAIVSMVIPHPHAHNLSAGACPFEGGLSQEKLNHNLNPNLTYDWSPTTQGVVLGSFWYSYALMQVPSGRMAEEFGGKWIISLSLIGSAVVNLITPFVTYSLTLLIMSRIVLGFLQSGIFPSCYALIYKWVPLQERSTALAFMEVGGTLGSIGAASMTGYLSEHGFAGGWPSAFYVSGLISLVTFILWVPLVRSLPEEHPMISEPELSYILSTRGDGKGDTNKPKINPPVPWRAILTSTPVLAVIVYKLALGWTFFTMLSKLPAYMNDVLHVKPTENGLLNASLYTATIFTLITVGMTSEKIIRKGILSRTATRKFFASIAATGAVICLFLVPSLGCNKVGVMFLFIFANFCGGCGSGADGPIPGELTSKFPATVFALANCISCTSGFIAPYVIGVILESNVGDLQYLWRCVFYLAGSLAAFGLTMFLLFGSAKIQPWDSDLTQPVELNQCAATVNDEDTENWNDASSDDEMISDKNYVI